MISSLRWRVGSLVATTMVLAIFDVAAAAPLPSFTDVQSAYGTSEALLLDRHGVPLSELRLDPRVRQLDWIRLADVSPAIAATLVAAEDKRFFEHGGVDWSGLAGAAWDSVWRKLDGRGARGGSTLTMQLAGMLDPKLAPAGSSRTLTQKWDQAQAALALERTWSKPQILEAYLNLASYRGELKGLDAAANGLFGKAPAGLDAREAAILVALLRGPNAPAALVAQRACSVAVLSAPEVACEEVRAMTTVALAGAYRMRARWNLAPHLAAKLLKSPGERRATTLDAEVQRYAIDTLRQHLAELAERGVGDGAIVALDNATGEVLAYVGSGGELSSAAHVDGVVAPRQAGSTLKPFLYALALDSRLLTAASLVDDSPVAIATERGMYVPQNYDRQFRGIVSVRTALGSSLNVPAVRTLGLVGVDRFHGVLRLLGFDTLTEPDEYYGASLALGGADVNLLALANAYRALANGGAYGLPRFVPMAGTGKAEPRRVLGAQASFVVSDILADRGARAASFGLENPLATRVWSAVKTGTSKDMRDNWCIGFTSRYTVGVWVGNFSGASMHDVSGVTGAAPIWRDLIHRLHANELSLKPPAPPGLIEHEVAFEPPVEAERHEWFLPGTQTRLVATSAGANASVAVTPHIRYPAPETIVALDPDIADEHQRVVFQASPILPGMQWRIGETVLVDVHGRAAWSPSPGKYTLFLENEDGQALASVPFEVRGNIAR
ncbi:MAG TPA: penicillin-binding protein 1C [Casimicrobiaceae bacterium]|nr:penicillin-binding protein 1C [Casimicrobiaceae bacterium]